ncbi:hypothetical protein FM104_14965 [Microbacterium esteraromaticum]|uniref:Uncharacterized protein n=1 Tax=Microbacterium esteraromaticum TaxID=57043 RepID=A0A1R4KQH0_9MICO|nr:hypothetical protein FM104_14965 [Microbacterium esteraromaticum]
MVPGRAGALGVAQRVDGVDKGRQCHISEATDPARSAPASDAGFMPFLAIRHHFSASAEYLREISWICV